MNPDKIKQICLQSLDSDKAEDVNIIDLKGQSALADYIIVASGRSSRQVGAIAEKLYERLKASGVNRIKIEGKPTCDWVVIDAGDIVVHIFRPEVREFYNIEKMWSMHLPPEQISGLHAM